jgi:hypothetical protein
MGTLKTITAVLTRPDPEDPAYGRTDRIELRLEYGFPPPTLRLPKDDVFEVFQLVERSDSDRGTVDYIRTGTIPRTGGQD